MATVADRYIHLDADKQVALEVGDPREAWVLCIPGQELSDETLAQYGITVEDGLLVLPDSPPPKRQEATEPPPQEGSDVPAAGEAQPIDRRAELSARTKKDLVALGQSLGLDVPTRASAEKWIEAILAAEASLAAKAAEG